MRLVGRFDRGVRVLRGLAGGLARGGPRGGLGPPHPRHHVDRRSMCEPGRTRARPSRSVRTTTILKSAWSLAREARRSFLLASRRLRETPPIWRSGARGHIRSRAMGDESPPRSRSPAPRDDRSRSPAPRDDRSRSPARGDSPPRGRDYSRSRSRSPRRDDRRPPSRDRSPGHGGGGGRKTGVAGRWNPRGFGACGEPPNRPSRPLLSRARPRPFPRFRQFALVLLFEIFSSPGFQHRIPRPSSRETRAFVVPTVVSRFDRHLEARRDAPGGRVVPNVIRSPPSSPYIKPRYSSVRRSQASSLPTRAARTSFATSRASPTATCSRKARAWSTTKPTTIVRVSSAPSA